MERVRQELERMPTGHDEAPPRLIAPEPVSAPPTLEESLVATHTSLLALHAALVACPLPETLDPFVEVGRGLTRVMFDVGECLRQHPGIYRRPPAAAHRKGHVSEGREAMAPQGRRKAKTNSMSKEDRMLPETRSL